MPRQKIEMIVVKWLSSLAIGDHPWKRLDDGEKATKRGGRETLVQVSYIQNSRIWQKRMTDS